MNSEIITKFTIATAQGIDALLFLTQTIFHQKFEVLLAEEQVEHYIAENYNEQALLVEVNSMSNQWLVVYEAHKPVGFARVTSKGERPGNIANKRAVRIADFGVLKDYDAPAIRQSLFDKLMAVCKPYQAVWLTEYAENPDIDLFVSMGFVKQSGESPLYELPLPAVCLIRQV